jgi:hypothetical protein
MTLTVVIFNIKCKFFIFALPKGCARSVDMSRHPLATDLHAFSEYMRCTTDLRTERQQNDPIYDAHNVYRLSRKRPVTSVYDARACCRITTMCTVYIIVTAIVTTII